MTDIWVFPHGKVSNVCVIKAWGSLTPHILVTQTARLRRSLWKTELSQQLFFSLWQEDGYGEAIIITPLTFTILFVTFSDLHWHSLTIQILYVKWLCWKTIAWCCTLSKMQMVSRCNWNFIKTQADRSQKRGKKQWHKTKKGQEISKQHEPGKLQNAGSKSRFTKKKQNIISITK